LIKFLGVLILERQVTANHCVKNDATAPDVCAQAEVAFAFDHLWGCVTGGATSRFESLALLVQVAEPKVHNFDAVIMVQQ